MIKDTFVPASFEKKTKRLEEEKKALEKSRADRKALIAKRRTEWKDKAQKYHENLIKAEQHLIKEKREARNSGNFYMAPEAKVAFVIRIKGINHIRPQVKKILRLFRLRQLNNGVFIKVNKATMNMLKRIEPYVVYGYPNRKTVSDLIYKRGFAKINHARIPLSDNTIIEQSLGKIKGGFAVFAKYFNQFGLAVLVAVAGLIVLLIRQKHRKNIRMKYDTKDSREIENIMRKK